MMQDGSFLDQGRLPQRGDRVWVLPRFSDTAPAPGAVTTTWNIDQRGLANTYLDVMLDDGRTRHTSIDCVYDHLPVLVAVNDQYGGVRIWR